MDLTELTEWLTLVDWTNPITVPGGGQANYVTKTVFATGF